MSYFVYILKCNDKTLYTGITTDIERRLKEHQNKTGSHYTTARGADKIIYTEEHPDRSAASKRELQIKKLTRTEKIKLSSDLK